jgi:hypothetical protein
MSLTIVKAPEARHTGAQAELAAATAALAEARRVLEAAQERFERLAGPARALEAAKAALSEQNASHDGAVLAWVDADCQGDRPELPVEVIESERRIAQLTRDVRAVGTMQPTVAAAVEASSASHAAAHRLRDAALWACAPQACGPVLDRALELLNAAWREFAKIEGLKAEAWQSAHQPNSLHPDGSGPAHAAWLRCGELIEATRARAGVEPDLVSGRRLIDRLLVDPTAELE